MSYPVATNSNRTSSQGQAPLRQQAKSSLILQNLLTPGQEMPYPVPGNRFYVIAASGPITIRPDTQFTNTYYPGTGLVCQPENAFTLLTLKNPDPNNSLYFQIFVGFDGYDDRRLIYPSSQFAQILHSVYDSTNPPGGTAVNNINLPDLSGTIITDESSGKAYYAVNRQAFYAYCMSNTSGWYFKAVGGKVLGAIPQGQAVVIPSSGTLLNVFPPNSELLVGFVSEIYNCLPK